MNDKLCPLLTLTPNKIVDEGNTAAVSCIKEKCAWWVFDDLGAGDCAMVHLAKRYVEVKIKEVKD